MLSKRSGCPLAILVALALAQLARAGAPTSFAPPEVSTSALLERLGELFTVPPTPVLTYDVLNQLLTGQYATIFDNSYTKGRHYARRGHTQSGLLVSVDYFAYQDGYRQVVLTIGPTHVLTINDLRGAVADARLDWVEKSRDGQFNSRALFRDEVTVAKAEEAWEKYCQDVSGVQPELPALQIPAEYRQSFVALYDDESHAVFGYFCDASGSPPDLRDAQAELIDGRQVNALRYVLRGKSLVSRLYAAEALLFLEKKGDAILAADATVIEQLKSEDETVDTCSGCIHERMPARKVFRLFSSEQLKQFLR